MEKTTEVLARKTSRSTSRMEDPVSTPPYSGKNNRHPSPHGSASKSSVQPPTGPRHKKPRTHLSPGASPISAPNNTRQESNSTIRPDTFHEKNRQPQRERERERDRGHGSERGDREWERKTQPVQQSRSAPMEVDRRERERERERDRGGSRERERAGTSERSETNGGLQIRGSARHRGVGGEATPTQGQGRGRSPRRGPAAAQSGNGRANGLPNRPDNGYRGLAERMGL